MQKNIGNEVDFFPVDKYESFFQNNKIAISLAYYKENVKNELHFLPLDKYQRFVQIYTIILDF